MKKCICWRCLDYNTCNVNNMTEEQLKKLHCVKFGLNMGWSFEQATSHVVEVENGKN